MVVAGVVPGNSFMLITTASITYGEIVIALLEVILIGCGTTGSCRTEDFGVDYRVELEMYFKDTLIIKYRAFTFISMVVNTLLEIFSYCIIY